MWELAARCSKANAREAKLVGGKVCFTLEACSWREGGLLLKGQLPTDSGKSFKGGLSGCAGQGRGHTQSSTLGPDGHLAVGHLHTVSFFHLRGFSVYTQLAGHGSEYCHSP